MITLDCGGKVKKGEKEAMSSLSKDRWITWESVFVVFWLNLESVFCSFEMNGLGQEKYGEQLQKCAAVLYSIKHIVIINGHKNREIESSMYQSLYIVCLSILN